MGGYISSSYWNLLQARPSLPHLQLMKKARDGNGRRFLSFTSPCQFRFRKKELDIYIKDVSANQTVVGYMYEVSNSSEEQAWKICKPDGSPPDLNPEANGIHSFFVRGDSLLLIQVKPRMYGDFLRGITVCIWKLSIEQDGECYYVQKTKLWSGSPRRLPERFKQLKESIKHLARYFVGFD